MSPWSSSKFSAKSTRSGKTSGSSPSWSKKGTSGFWRNCLPKGQWSWKGISKKPSRPGCTRWNNTGSRWCFPSEFLQIWYSGTPTSSSCWVWKSAKWKTTGKRWSCPKDSCNLAPFTPLNSTPLHTLRKISIASWLRNTINGSPTRNTKSKLALAVTNRIGNSMSSPKSNSSGNSNTPPINRPTPSPPLKSTKSLTKSTKSGNLPTCPSTLLSKKSSG